MLKLHLDNSIIRKLSQNELSILEYIYAHPKEVMHMSIHELSKEVCFSSATILRFCKKIGLSGFSELKFILRNESQSSPTYEQPSNPINSKIILNTIGTDIEGTANLIKNDHFNEIVSLLASDMPIYLWAPGGITSILVEYLEKILFVYGRQKVFKLESERLTKHILRNINTPAIFFVISSSGTYDPTIRLSKIASVNNLKLITITPYNNNEISQLSPYSLHFFTNQRNNKDADITSRISIFYILSMLMRSYANSKEGKDQ